MNNNNIIDIYDINILDPETLSVGTIMVNYRINKEYIIRLDDSGEKYWSKYIRHEGYKMCITCDNDPRNQYQVFYNRAKKKVYIYRSDEHDNDYFDDFSDLNDIYDFAYLKLLHVYKNVKNILVGKCVEDDQHNGNSILLQINENKYTYVGETIKSFKTDDKIVNYYSWLSNATCPYGIVEGRINIYLMSDELSIKKEHLVDEKYWDPYGFANYNYDDENDMSDEKSKILKKYGKKIKMKYLG